MQIAPSRTSLACAVLLQAGKEEGKLILLGKVALEALGKLGLNAGSQGRKGPPFPDFPGQPQ